MTSDHPRTVRRGVLVALAVLTAMAALIPASTATAGEQVIKVKGKIIPAADSEGTTLCTYAAFLRWRIQDNAIDWEAHWERQGFPESERLKPPFDDRVVFDDPMVPGSRTFKAPKGYHWYMLDFGGAQGPPQPLPPDCSPFAANLAALYAKPYVNVTLKTPGGADECTIAKAKLKSAKAKLRAAKRGGNKKEIRKAKKAVKKAKKKKKKACKKKK
ncbi:MAG: hypothetical protein KDB46_05460 [Solirubrobacterales bacterium]|nr:hypothetical protein [Solirubrobacterales bacterium]